MNATLTFDDAYAPAEAVSLRRWVALLGAILGAFMAVLDIQITNASLNDILGSLGATLDEGSWISTSYLVAEIIVIPLTGWMAQVFTVRRYLLVNTVLFLFASVACAWSWNLNSLIVFRVMQGFTGGVLIPMAFTLVLKPLPPSKQTTGLALYGITITFAAHSRSRASNPWRSSSCSSPATEGCAPTTIRCWSPPPPIFLISRKIS